MFRFYFLPVLLALPIAALCDTLVLPNELSNNSIADADKVQGNFDALTQESNENDARISANENALSQLAGVATLVATAIVNGNGTTQGLSVDGTTVTRNDVGDYTIVFPDGTWAPGLPTHTVMPVGNFYIKSSFVSNFGAGGATIRIELRDANGVDADALFTLAVAGAVAGSIGSEVTLVVSAIVNGDGSTQNVSLPGTTVVRDDIGSYVITVPDGTWSSGLPTQTVMPIGNFYVESTFTSNIGNGGARVDVDFRDSNGADADALFTIHIAAVATINAQPSRSL